MYQYQEYKAWQNRIDTCDACEVIPFGPLAGCNRDWTIDYSHDAIAIITSEAYDRYYDRMENRAIEAACGNYERKHEDTWPEAYAQ